jgi:hypothetical protein
MRQLFIFRKVADKLPDERNVGGGGGTSGELVPVLIGFCCGLVVTVALRLIAGRLSALTAFTVRLLSPPAVSLVVR